MNLLWEFDRNNVKNDWHFFPPCTQNTILEVKCSIYCGSSLEIFGTARKLWLEFVLEHLLWIFVINVIKGPFKMAILHLSWDDAWFLRLFQTQRKRTNGSYQSCRLTLQILIARIWVWRWPGKRKRKLCSWTDIWMGQLKNWSGGTYSLPIYHINLCCIYSVFKVLMFSTSSQKIFLPQESSKKLQCSWSQLPLQSLGIHLIHLWPLPTSWSSHILLLSHADHNNGNQHL